MESTPKIDASEIKKAKVSSPSVEEQMFARVVPTPPAEWVSGKEFIVSDPKIRLIFSPDKSGALPELEAGTRLQFKEFAKGINIMGEATEEAVFSAPGFPELRYRMPRTGEDSQMLEIPFTVDPELAERADSVLQKGSRTLYISTPIWYDATTEQAVQGYRLVPVRVDSVRPGSHIFPLKLYFHVDDGRLASTAKGQGEKMVLMSHGGQGHANSRSFAALFSLTDPRKRYSQVSDETWTLIINSKVSEGMTKDECRLALGSPTNIELTPTRVGDIERWSYSDGVYLIFNPEGTLMRYRL